MVTMPRLKLVRETKICDLMTCDQPAKRWEASGVLVKDGYFFVVFDDRTEIARFSDDLEPNKTNGLFGMAHAACGYEGITYNAAKQRFYLLVEARKQTSGCYQASIVEYDDEFRYLKDRPVDFTFKSLNKGFVAVAHVQRNNKDYLLALCEGNKCKCGDKGRKPGGGRVQVFEKKRKRWAHFRTIALPTTLPFVDYSGMSIDRGHVTVDSQVSSKLWVGQCDEAGWERRDGKPATWTVKDGYMEVKGGDIKTREKFGPDFKLHVEFWLPLMEKATGQGRANSGVYLQGRYEIQVLDSYMNDTYANGSVGALYGIIAPDKAAQQKAVKPPEQWNTYDITFHSPRVDDNGKMTQKGRLTVVLNGVRLIDNGAFDHTTGGALDNKLGTPGPLLLQDHGCKVRYRNIWIRRLKGYDQPE